MRIAWILTISVVTWPVYGQDARIATGAATGAYHRIGQALADSLAGRGGMELEVVETQGSLDNLRRLRQREADFALMQGALQADSTGLTALANIDYEYVHVIVLNDSPLESFRDLAGKRLLIGPEGSGNSSLGRFILDFYAFEPPVEAALEGWESLDDRLRAGAVDAALMVFSLHAPFMETLLASGEFRILPIIEFQAAARYIPGVEAGHIPPYTYGPDRRIPDPAEGPLPTLAVHTLLIAREDTSARMIQSVLEALYGTSVIRDGIRGAQSGRSTLA